MMGSIIIYTTLVFQSLIFIIRGTVIGFPRGGLLRGASLFLKFLTNYSQAAKAVVNNSVTATLYKKNFIEVII